MIGKIKAWYNSKDDNGKAAVFGIIFVAAIYISLFFI